MERVVCDAYSCKVDASLLKRFVVHDGKPYSVACFTSCSLASVSAFQHAIKVRHPASLGPHLVAFSATVEISSRMFAFILCPHSFSTALPQGIRIHIEDDGCQMTKLRSSRSIGWTGRLESTAFGNDVVSRGVATWVAMCTGENFMVGIVPDNKWDAFADEDPTFVPFVYKGEGFGVGLLAWDGLFLCQQGSADQKLDIPELSAGAQISVVLDMDSGHVRFLLDGERLLGAEAPVSFTACRFAASVYGGGKSLRILPPLAANA